MAEYLIYNKDHWSVGVKAIVSSNWDAKVIAKMTRVYEKGDIVEVRPDGYWSKLHGWRKDVFALLKIPEKSVESTKHYMSNQTDAKGEMVKKRRYNINTISFSLEKEQKVSSVSVYDKSVSAVIING